MCFSKQKTAYELRISDWSSDVCSSVLTATQLVFIFTTRLQELVIGSVIGVVAVGIYRTAWRTVDMISNGAIRPFATVAMQTLARDKHDQAELGRAYQWMISKAAVISFPALTGFGMVAPLAIPAVFGPKWEIGRASWRERGGPVEYLRGGAGS